MLILKHTCVFCGKIAQLQNFIETQRFKFVSLPNHAFWIYNCVDTMKWKHINTIFDQSIDKIFKNLFAMKFNWKNNTHPNISETENSLT